MLLPHQGHLNPSKHELNLDQASMLTFTRSVRSVYSAALPGEVIKPMESVRRIRGGKSGNIAKTKKDNRPHHLHTGAQPMGPQAVGKIIPVDAGQDEILRTNSVEAVPKRGAGGHHRVTIDEPVSLFCSFEFRLEINLYVM